MGRRIMCGCREAHTGHLTQSLSICTVQNAHLTCASHVDILFFVLRPETSSQLAGKNRPDSDFFYFKIIPRGGSFMDNFEIVIFEIYPLIQWV